MHDQDSALSGMVYFITDGIAVKIGYTEDSIVDCLERLQCESARKLSVIRQMKGTLAMASYYRDLFADRIDPTDGWLLITSDDVMRFGTDQEGFVLTSEDEKRYKSNKRLFRPIIEGH